MCTYTYTRALTPTRACAYTYTHTYTTQLHTCTLTHTRSPPIVFPHLSLFLYSLALIRPMLPLLLGLTTLPLWRVGEGDLEWPCVQPMAAFSRKTQGEGDPAQCLVPRAIRIALMENTRSSYRGCPGKPVGHCEGLGRCSSWVGRYSLPSWEAGWCLERVWDVKRQSSCVFTVFPAFGHYVSGQRTPTWKVTQVLFSLWRVAQGSHKHSLLSQASALGLAHREGPWEKKALQMEEGDSVQGRHARGPVFFSFPFRGGMYRSQPL